MQFRSLACVPIKSSYSYFHRKGDFCQHCCIHHTKILIGDEKQLSVIRDEAVIAQQHNLWRQDWSLIHRVISNSQKGLPAVRVSLWGTSSAKLNNNVSVGLKHFVQDVCFPELISFSLSSKMCQYCKMGLVCTNDPGHLLGNISLYAMYKEVTFK